MVDVLSLAGAILAVCAGLSLLAVAAVFVLRALRPVPPPADADLPLAELARRKAAWMSRMPTFRRSGCRTASA